MDSFGNRIRIRQPRVIRLDNLHNNIRSYMASNSYNDDNRAYILNVGFDNFTPAGKENVSMSIPYPGAKDYRAIVILPSNHLFHSDAVSQITEDRMWDVDLGARNEKHKVIFTNKEGKRAEDYVTSSTIERYMNFADAAYADGRSHGFAWEGSLIRMDDFQNADKKFQCVCTALSIVSNQNDNNLKEHMINMLKRYTGENETVFSDKLFCDFKDVKNELVEKCTGLVSGCNENKTSNKDSLALYSKSYAKGEVDNLYLRLKSLASILEPSEIEYYAHANPCNLERAVKDRFVFFQSFLPRYGLDVNAINDIKNAMYSPDDDDGSGGGGNNSGCDVDVEEEKEPSRRSKTPSYGDRVEPDDSGPVLGFDDDGPFYDSGPFLGFDDDGPF